MRRITLLGSTGSIGTQALDVIREFPDRLEVVGLSAGSNIDLLAEQAREFRPRMVHVGASGRFDSLCDGMDGFAGEILHGADGLRRIATESGADLLVVATVGFVGLEPTLAAIDQGIDIALANKEVLVVGGELVTEAARRKGVRLLPIDSEHNAIFQCLQAGRVEDVRRLILTCSGGPFREAAREAIDAAGPEKTLNHPTWDMGRKITVDSATLMNKGFEVIEAHHLFGLPVERVEVVVHPQSTVHSMVEFCDGSILAQLGPTDMRMPIQHVLLFPERHPSQVAAMDWTRAQAWTFAPPDLERFPCLGYAYEAARAGGTLPCVLNAANEVAVAAHLDGRVSCGDIARVIRAVLDAHTLESHPALDRLLHVDRWARDEAERAIERMIESKPARR